MKTFKFTTYEPGMGAECISGTYDYYVTGLTLKAAKTKLVAQKGCTKDFFDDPKYTIITEVSTERGCSMTAGSMEIQFYKHGGVTCKLRNGFKKPPHYDRIVKLITAHESQGLLSRIDCMHGYIRGIESAFGIRL